MKQRWPVLDVLTSSWRRSLFAGVESAPVALPAMVGAFGSVAILLLLLGQLHNWLVWPLGLLTAAIVAWQIFKYGHGERPGTRQERRRFDVLILLLVVVWVAGNMRYTSQHVFTDRDPATYSVTAVHLIHNANLKIAAPPEFQNLRSVNSASPGFETVPQQSGRLYAQGLHLLPVLLGLAGRVVGETRMFHLAPLLGGLALLALYGFARLLVRPKWAFTATLLMSVSLPLIFFSRDIYTEPLAMALTFGALSLIWLAQSSHRLRLWFIAGLLSGAGLLTRIDALTVIAALIAFITFYLISRPVAERPHARLEAGWFMIGLLATAGLGWLDLTRLSTPYFVLERQLLKVEVGLVIFAMLAGVATLYLSRHKRGKRLLNKLTWLWQKEVLAIGILAVALLLVSRPLWMTSYTKIQNDFVAGIQTATGYPVQPRDYAEISTQWVNWYIGPAIAALGVFGLALAGWRLSANNRRNGAYAAGFLVVATTAFLYLLKPSIVPDQVWASRRFLPVVLPGLVVFGVFILSEIEDRLPRLKFKPVFVGLGIAFLLLAPLQTSRPFIRTRTDTRLAAIRDICQALPANAAVVWTAQAQYELVQPTIEFCHVPAAGLQYTYPARASRIQLARLSQHLRRLGKTPVIGVYGEHASHIAADYRPGSLTEVANYSYQQLERTLLTPPSQAITKTNAIELGIIEADGSVHTL